MKVHYFGRAPDVAAHIGGFLGITFPGDCHVLGLLAQNLHQSDFGLVGGFVFTGRAHGNVDMSCYAPRLVTREVLGKVAWLVYDHWKCQRMTARCRRVNEVARKTLLKGGFVFEGCQRRYYGPTKHDDAMVYGMLASECRWLGVRENGRADPSRPDGDRASADPNEQGYCDNAVRAGGH